MPSPAGPLDLDPWNHPKTGFNLGPILVLILVLNASGLPSI